MSARYTIDGGAAGKQRLDVLARICAPGTTGLLDRVGVSEGARCLDIGCGGGHVTRELARRAGPAGLVVGIDLDATVLELARHDAAADGIGNVEFRQGDVAQLDESGYDIAYARFLLSHVSDPAAVVDAIAVALRPGGVAILEDIHFAGYFCHPHCRAHDRWVEIYRETVRRRGGNAELGLALPVLLHEAGFERVGVGASQECGLDGEVKEIAAITLERVARAVVDEGVADEDEVAQTVAGLYAHAADPGTVMGMPPVVQAWGTIS